MVFGDDDALDFLLVDVLPVGFEVFDHQVLGFGGDFDGSVGVALAFDINNQLEFLGVLKAVGVKGVEADVGFVLKADVVTTGEFADGLFEGDPAGFDGGAGQFAGGGLEVHFEEVFFDFFLAHKKRHEQQRGACAQTGNGGGSGS